MKRFLRISTIITGAAATLTREEALLYLTILITALQALIEIINLIKKYIETQKTVH